MSAYISDDYLKQIKSGIYVSAQNKTEFHKRGSRIENFDQKIRPSFS
jgi:hypothetical protein